MRNAVMTKKPNKPKTETAPIEEKYPNYTNHGLAGMISNTSDELQEEIRRLDNLHEETEAYKYDLDSAYNSYKEEQQAMQEHLAQIQRAEEQVKNLSKILEDYTNAFTSRIAK